MSDASGTQRCEKCGAEYTASASPLGLCPACLLKLGMSDPAITPPREPDAGAGPASEPVAVVAPPPPPVRPRLQIPLWAWIAGIAILVLLVIVFNLFVQRLQPRGARTSALSNTVRFTLTLPDEARMPDAARFAVSPDGTHLVVVARDRSGTERLWLRRLQSLEWRALPRTDGASFPFWSPDSRHVGFFADKALKRIDVANELTQVLCTVNSGRGGTWGIGNVIVFADASGLSRVSATGGDPLPVTRVDAARGQRAHLSPQFLPDGRRFVFFVDALSEGKNAMHVGEIDAAGSTAIADDRGPAAFVDDVLLFSRGGTLAAQPFNPEGGELSGEAQSLGGVEDVDSDLADGPAFSASNTVLVYRRQDSQRRQLTWFDREGRHLGVVGAPAQYTSLAVSPDGRRVAVARRDEDESSIWLMDVNSERINRITSGPLRDASLAWSPDGSRIVFNSRRGEVHGVYAVAANGGGQEEELLRSPEPKRITGVSRDNRLLIYTAWSPETGMDVWALTATGDRKSQPIEQSRANESQGTPSPDGRWMAFVSDESGKDQIHVRALPPSEGRWQISIDGGTHPRWRGDGRELYFLSTDGQLMAVDVARASPVEFGVPRMLVPLGRADGFDVSSDGRFLVQLPVDEPGGRELHVVLNWAAELRR